LGERLHACAGELPHSAEADLRRRGELAEALSQAASQGPGCVLELAARAQVGRAAAKYTASRMVARGELVVVEDGRPAVLGLPDLSMAGDDLECAFVILDASFWDRPSHGGGA
jgi:hypothetical protein